jgi:hypothetical protein
MEQQLQKWTRQRQHTRQAQAGMIVELCQHQQPLAKL